jgi:hypothetical protein
MLCGVGWEASKFSFRSEKKLPIEDVAFGTAALRHLPVAAGSPLSSLQLVQLMELLTHSSRASTGGHIQSQACNNIEWHSS